MFESSLRSTSPRARLPKLRSVREKGKRLLPLVKIRAGEKRNTSPRPSRKVRESIASPTVLITGHGNGRRHSDHQSNAHHRQKCPAEGPARGAFSQPHD